MNQIQELTELIKNSKNTVFFGGAGVSTESGIPDFRSESGLFAVREVYGYSPEDLISRPMLDKNPALFFRYYKENFIIKNIKPNPAHFALANLEERGMLQAVITQNVDGLHQDAGSKNVLEFHGSNFRHYCTNCGEKHDLDYILDESNCDENSIPLCKKCGNIVRPDVVLYGEQLNEAVLTASIKAVKEAELLIVGGTSLLVYPAASLLNYFKGHSLVLINKSKTPADRRAMLVIHDSIGKILGEAVN